MVPNPAEPPAPCTAVPEENVCAQLVLPSCCRPCSFGKLAMASCPNWVERPLVNTAETTPVESIETVLSWPVVKPFCERVVTPNCVPNSVLWPKLKVMLIGCAPSVGWNPAKVRLPPGGAVTAPVFEKVRVWVPPTWVPFTVMLTFQTPGVAVCEKNMVAGNELPSESNTVVEVD